MFILAMDFPAGRDGQQDLKQDLKTAIGDRNNPHIPVHKTLLRLDCPLYNHPIPPVAEAWINYRPYIRPSDPDPAKERKPTDGRPS